MTALDDLLKKARQAGPAHRDVDLVLDSELAGQIAELEQELVGLNSDLRFSDPRPVAVRNKIDELQAKAVESLVRLRFTRLPGKEWADLTSRSMPRFDVAIDTSYNYNYHEVAEAAARLTGRQINDDSDPVELTSEQWDGLFEVLSGHEYERVCSAVFELNEWEPQQRIVAAGKASRAGSATSSVSPSPSA